MNILNRFKSKKEQEVEQKGSTVADVSVQEKKEETKKVVPKKESKKIKLVREATTSVILQPLVTEKAARLSTLNTYVFRINRRATRVQVMEAFTDLYGVQPIRVNIINHRAEPVRFGRLTGKQTAWKKAMVTLPKGKKVQIYEGI
ncbi:MAG: 50S ribosomal protein L23 [Patescibacteria group bacterium]